MASCNDKDSHDFENNTSIEACIPCINNMADQESDKSDRIKIVSPREQKIPPKKQKDSPKKETICQSKCNEQGNLNKPHRTSGTYEKSINDTTKKLPPFRTGRYIPVENIYSPFHKEDHPNKGLSASGKGKSSSEKLNTSPSGSPPAFRKGKCSNRVTSVCANSGERFDRSCLIQRQHATKDSRISTSCELIDKKGSSSTQGGRFSPDSPRSHSPKGKVILQESRRSSSLEGIAPSKSTNIGTLKSSSKISHSADSVNDRKHSPRTRPKSYAVNINERRRTRTKTENPSRPKSSVLESQKPSLSKSAKGPLNPLHKIIQDNIHNQTKNESGDVLTPLSPRSSKKEIKSSKLHSRPKSVAVLDSRSQRDNQENTSRFIRKGSDSRDSRPIRPHSAVVLSSSASERTYNQIKPRKARRVPQRNIYVKRRRKRVPSKTPSQQKSNKTLKDKQKIKKTKNITPKDEPDGVPPPKKKTFCAYGDKFCIRIKRKNQDIVLPSLRRCRVMVWKIRRISYDLYEKVILLMGALGVH